MVVTVILVRMMQATVDQVVDVVAMRHRLMAALWTVFVICRVIEALLHRRTSCRILVVRLDHVLVNMIPMRMMQVSIVQVVDVITMADGGMPTSWPVSMRMISMYLMSAGRHS
jgi:hypothetical protein